MDPLDVLVVDDEPGVCRALEKILSSAGHEVRIAESLKQARTERLRRVPDVVFLDLRLPDGNGLELLEELKRDVPHVEVVIVTAHVDVNLARRSLLLGAVDLIEKPFVSSDVVAVVEGVVGLPRALREAGRRAAGALIGNSPTFVKACHDLVLLAASDKTPGLLFGELGTGRELSARALHDASSRSGGPFVAASCVTLTAPQLLGCEPRALPAAPDGQAGILERASSGTLFLGEIHELDLELQGQLLAVLQTGEFRRLGGLTPRTADVRIVAATHVAPKRLAEQAVLREDLYYQLAVMPIRIPPLRERGEDVVYLAQHFLKDQASSMGRNATGFSAQALRRLQAYPWPGNVRELRNVIERAVILAQGQRVEVAELRIGDESTGDPAAGGIRLSLPDYRVASAERALIRLALEETGGHKTLAAELLGINRATLYNKLKAYGLTPPRRIAQSKAE
ncbi:MAG: sigma-54-dependent Fis family transcriptional regulator [Planctomycetes bacterium]|nr:sigma-54-dependent Fis family transcriptional regulator [Planctomycetota bacterium]